MRRTAISTLKSLLAGLLLLAASVSGASAQSLGPALQVYAEGLVLQRAGMLTCGAPRVPVNEEADWQKARAILLATLWAHNFPDDFVGRVGETLNAEPATPPDCNDKRFIENVSMTADGDWVGRVSTMLGHVGLEPVAEPLTLAQLDDIQLIFAEESFAQTRLLACIAVHYPAAMPDMVKFWDDMVGGVGAQLVLRGAPRAELETLIGKALSQSIWQPVAAAEQAALKADCNANDDWYQRWGRFQYNGLRSRVEALIGRAQQ